MCRAGCARCSRGFVVSVSGANIPRMRLEVMPAAARVTDEWASSYSLRVRCSFPHFPITAVTRHYKFMVHTRKRTGGNGVRLCEAGSRNASVLDSIAVLDTI